MLRCDLRRLVAAVAVSCGVSGAFAADVVPPIDLAAAGAPFSRGVRGLALPSINQVIPQEKINTETTLAVVRGSSLRGVAGGLEADIYDWRTRNHDARATTLDYLRFARDHQARLVITANIRGLVEPDAAGDPGSQRFYDSSIETVAKVAAQWVRYTNVIAQNHRQGGPPPPPADQAILDGLQWTTSTDDAHDVLPRADEPPLPKVELWEIGNEPRVPVKAYRVNNSFTFFAPDRPRDAEHQYDFTERYAAMAAAMKEVDPGVKVGPALQTVKSAAEREIVRLLLGRQADGKYLPVDFLSYHPYQRLFKTNKPAEIEARLRDVYDEQAGIAQRLRELTAESGREPDSVSLMASEINVSYWDANETPVEARMGHALGSVETVFSFARLGLTDAHYWLWPASSTDGTKYPVYLAYEGMRDHLGDTLLAVYGEGNHRLYATRDSQSGELAIWGLNFSNDRRAALRLDLSGLPADGYTATLKSLRALHGTTTLLTSNLAGHMEGGPTNHVGWTVAKLAGAELSSYVLEMPAATISVLVIAPNRR